MMRIALDDPELLEEEFFEALEKRIEPKALMALRQECNDELGLLVDTVQEEVN